MLQLLLPDDCRRLVDFFTGAGYTLTALRDDRKLTERASRRFGTIPYLLEQTAEPSAFHTLARWFTIGVPSAADHVPRWVLELLLHSGMLRATADQFEPTVMLCPLETMLIAADPVLKWEDDPEDLVLWPNPTTQQLFNFTIRKPYRRALDFGCGCGIQALGAAQHSESVVATDLNARAVEFSAFNARLNGFENVECLAGDCFEPVRGRTFDLIAANPPFFITPSTVLMYCENTMELDLFCRRLVKEAPEYLEESGYFQMVCEWVEIKGEPWRDRIAGWLEGTGCDAWVIKQYSMTPSSYGNERVRQRPTGNASDEHKAFADWIAFYHQKEMVAIHGGLITLRKRSGRNWARIEQEPISLDSAVGDLILNGFETRDLLASTTDAGMLALRPRVAAGTRLNQILGQGERGWSPQSLRLHLTGARNRQIDMDPAVAQFVGRFDGTKDLGSLIQDFAAQMNASVDQVATESVSITRKLLDQGYLEV